MGREGLCRSLGLALGIGQQGPWAEMGTEKGGAQLVWRMEPGRGGRPCRQRCCSHSNPCWLSCIFGTGTLRSLLPLSRCEGGSASWYCGTCKPGP